MYDPGFYIQNAQRLVNETDVMPDSKSGKRLTPDQRIALAQVYAMMGVAAAVAKANLFVRMLDQ